MTNFAEVLTVLADSKMAYTPTLVVAYGAPGKGNTLLNYCGIRTDLLAYTVDRNVHKHGRFTPGTHIPIHELEKRIKELPKRREIVAYCRGCSPECDRALPH